MGGRAMGYFLNHNEHKDHNACFMDALVVPVVIAVV
jgi:hypothetical protein